MGVFLSADVWQMKGFSSKKTSTPWRDKGNERNWATFPTLHYSRPKKWTHSVSQSISFQIEKEIIGTVVRCKTHIKPLSLFDSEKRNGQATGLRRRGGVCGVACFDGDFCAIAFLVRYIIGSQPCLAFKHLKDLVSPNFSQMDLKHLAEMARCSDSASNSLHK